ncbi:MAG: DinB family protein [Roseivirga sp.]|nr:DinB family protein [Roseivirga sp.]
MKKITIIASLCLLATALQGQSLKTDRLLYSWKNMKNMVVNSAKAMPEEHYSYVPVEGVRGYADQVKHITTSNRYFITMVSGGNPADIGADNQKTQGLQSKAEIIADLEQSFDYVISKIPEIQGYDNEFDLFGQKVTRTEGLMLMEHHLHREQGKIIFLMRMKGVAPAKSTSWLL